MGRKPVKMELIANRSSRASTLKKRQASVIKKAEELSKLCGIDVCVLVSAGPDNAAPVVWPPPEQASQIISHFQSRSEAVRSKKQSGQVAKLQHQLQKIDLETDNISKDISDGSRVGDTACPDSAKNFTLSALVERRLKEVQDKINFLNSAQVQQDPTALDVEVRMPGVYMEQDPVMEFVGADGTNLDVHLPQVLPSEEETFELGDESTGGDWISNGVPFLEWDDLVNDWVLKFITGDVAPLPDLADEFNVDVGYATSGLIGAVAAGSFPAGCTVEVGMPGIRNTTDMNLVSSREVLTSDEEMPGFPMKTDWISSSGPFLEWDDVVKDWMLEPSTADVAPLPDSTFDFAIDNLDLDLDDNTIKSVMSYIN